jgi:hypothetical protein
MLKLIRGVTGDSFDKIVKLQWAACHAVPIGATFCDAEEI